MSFKLIARIKNVRVFRYYYKFGNNCFIKFKKKTVPSEDSVVPSLIFINIARMVIIVFVNM